MDRRVISPHGSLRLSAGMLLAGQLLYIVATRLHVGGDGNDHPAIFAAYAASGIWTAVHLGQFAGMAVLLAGLLALSFALDAQDGRARWATRFGAAFAVAALALYGVLQAVEGIALKQAVNAWVSAPDAEKPARFASAETIRWLEWGVRSYQDFALGLSGLIYLVQGWMIGSEGFSPAQSVVIVLAWIVSLAWMIWLTVLAWRVRPSRLADEDGGSLTAN